MSRALWGLIYILAAVLALTSCRSDVLSLRETDARNQPAAKQKTLPGVDPAIQPESGTEEANDQVIASSFSKTERVPPMALVLAMSWQPGFCETAEKKSECQSQRPDRYDATHFTLHGLWPQPRSKTYCNVKKINRQRDRAGNWLDLPAVQTSVKTRQRLQRVMPGTRSALDRHEWIKHGTCYSKGAETYYRDSLALMEAINNSAVQRMFERNIGKELTSGQIRAVFDTAFGRGTGKRVRVSCKRDGNRQLITELTLGLNGVVGDNPNIGRLASRSRPINAGCPRGIVDAVGLQ